MRNIVNVTILTCFALCTSAQVKYKTENVFVITLDGFRWQEMFTGADSSLVQDKNYVTDPIGLKNLFWAKTAEERRKILMPFFWNDIVTEGQLYGNRNYGNKVNCTNKMWFSYPGYSEILCGYADDARIKTNNKIDNPNVTVLEFLNRQPRFKGKVAAFGSWDVFPFIINEERSGIPVNAGFEKASGLDLTEREIFLNELLSQLPSPWANVRLDGFTYHYAMEYLKKHTPRVVYVSFGETDDFAHGGKYDAYLKSAQQNDAFIKGLWDWAQSQPAYQGRTTFIITTDHGRGTVPIDEWRSHGAEIKGADEIWIAVMGPDVKQKGEMRSASQLYQNQVAASVTDLLGLIYKSEKPAGSVIGTITK